MKALALTGLALLAVICASGVPALAQTQDKGSTELELKHKRTIVAPPTDVESAKRDADAATKRTEEQRQLEEYSKKATQKPSPPLDESVVEGSRARQRQESGKP